MCMLSHCGVNECEMNLSHSRQRFNTLIQQSWTVGSVAYTVFIWSRLITSLELLTRYTTLDTKR